MDEGVRLLQLIFWPGLPSALLLSCFFTFCLLPDLANRKPLLRYRSLSCGWEKLLRLKSWWCESLCENVVRCCRFPDETESVKSDDFAVSQKKWCLSECWLSGLIFLLSKLFKSSIQIDSGGQNGPLLYQPFKMRPSSRDSGAVYLEGDKPENTKLIARRLCLFISSSQAGKRRLSKCSLTCLLSIHWMLLVEGCCFAWNDDRDYYCEKKCCQA